MAQKFDIPNSKAGGSPGLEEDGIDFSDIPEITGDDMRCVVIRNPEWSGRAYLKIEMDEGLALQYLRLGRKGADEAIKALSDHIEKLEADRK